MAARRHRLKPAAFVPVLALALGAGGCAVPGAPRAGTGVPERDEARVPATESPTAGLSAAGSALVTQSRSERRAGDYAQASATLERALRIEPGAPVVWLELARLRLAEGNLAQAEQLARKAQSLAGSGSAVAQESQAVLMEVLRRKGGGS